MAGLKSIGGQFTQIAANAKQLVFDSMKVAKLYGISRENGPITNRRDIILVTRTKSDLFKLLPSLLYICLPFTIPTLPLVIRYFPKSVPQFLITKQMKSIKNNHLMMKQKELGKNGVAAFVAYLESLKLTEPRFINDRKMLIQLMKQKKKLNAIDFSQHHQFISNYMTIKDLPRNLISIMYIFTGGHALSPLKRVKLLKESDWIMKDDLLLKEYGLQNLDRDEVIEALFERMGGTFYGSDFSALETIERLKLGKFLSERVEFENQLRQKLELFEFSAVFYLNRMHMASIS